MESSEDDAGAAAIASRRPSARESDMQQESDGGTLAAGACGDGDPAGPDRDTPGLSEYFDGDSVPSPSQDANTSTEAILDMIDEFVDGPGAPRRLPLEACEAPAPATAADALQTPSDTDNLSQQTTCQSEPAIESETCSASEPAAITPDAVSATVEPPCAEQSVGDVDSAQTEQSDVSEPASSSVAMEVEQAPMAHEQSVSSNDIVTPSSCNTTTSTASTLDPKETVTMASTSDPVVNHEILTSERTMKCVSSTDTANVTVESAESTSSDSLVSTPITRSPLKRRLVRPAKPDTTVTSTVDVHSTAPQSENLASSESVTKAVSSSSDSIIATCEENSSDSNSNMSSLSVTSVSTPRKIKLIRSKVLQSASSAQDITEQCQSTSTTPVVTAAVPESQEPIESSSNSDSSHMPCSDDKDVKTLNENEHLQHSEGLKPSVPITNCTQVTETLDSNQIDEPTKSLDAIVKTSEDVKPKPEVIPEALIEEINLKSNAKDSEPQSMVEDTLSKPVVEEKAIVANNEEVKTEPVLDERRVPPIKLNVSSSMVTEHLVSQQQSELTDCQESISIEPVQEVPDTLKQVPKLTIKLGNKLSDGPKSPVPKLTIKPIRPPTDAAEAMTSSNEQIPKLIIKPIVKPPEKVNDIHRKSSSSEISESEVSENDETSNSDQTSASDQGSANVIPKVTIKLGKAGTESEGIFYTEKNAHKICSKPAEDYKEEETVAKIKLKITQNQHEERIYEKIPKLTIKTVVKADSPQPISPKLIIKPLKPPDHHSKELKVETAELPIPKLKITTESLSPREVKENSHVPKITIKAVTRSDSESSKVLKKSRDEDLDVPVVTKLNIKPIPNPAGTFGDKSDRLDDKVPVVSKLNIKPIVRPNDNDLDGNVEGVPKVTKLNIKPIKNPELIYSETKDCDDLISGSEEKSIPVVTKLNIKPIIKPIDEDMSKDSENQSSETGNSSDDNSDQIPVVTKLNIKPIVKPSTTDGQKSSEIIPIVTKLNIKPLVKPEDIGPISPKKDSHKRLEDVPVITKLNIKPILRPEEIEETKNPPLVMKINIKSMNENYSEGNKVNSNDDHIGSNNIDDKTSTIPKVTIKPIVKPPECETPAASANCMLNDVSETKSLSTQNKFTEPLSQNCVPESKSKDLSPLVQDKTILRMNDEPRRWKSKETVSHQFNCVDQSYAKKDDSLAEKLGDQTRQEALEQLSKLAQKTSTQSCTLLKKLLAEDNTKRDPEKSVLESFLGNSSVASKKPVENCEYKSGPGLQKDHDNTIKVNSVSSSSTTDINATKPLEINTTLEKTSSSGQDSPRIILKINKTDFGTSSEIITEDMKSSEPMTAPEDKVIEKKPVIHRRNKKDLPGDLADVDVGKRLRSSRVVQDTEKAPTPRRNAGKRPHNSEEKPEENKESGISLLESKKAKLGKMLANTSLPIAPAADVTANALPAEPDAKDLRPAPRMNHTVLNNENCTNKNGSSKLHRILSNLQAKQMPQNDIKNTENSTQTPDGETTSTSSEVTDTIQCISNKMYINEGTATPIFGVAADESAEDPLDTSRSAASGPPTPAPRKRGRPRKVPLSTPVAEQTPQPPPAPAPPPAPLPVPALEERPQRSLRLSRERTPVVSKPRGRGRGRGAKRTPAPAPAAPVDTAAKHFADVAEQTERKPSPEKTEGLPSAEKIEGLPSAEKKEDIDPTSSRIKLPRMTEALESSCSTPLTSRRRSLDTVTTDLKVVLDVMPKLPEEVRSPEARRGGRGGRGRRGARTPATTPRKAGRGRGGGRGAVYMKETMGIYGRVCGPATTTVQLFEEETCMMDDNATHDKPSHLQDEDSQSSVKSCTNDSGKAKRSKFDDLFDSKRVWTAADVKEYTWPPPGTLTSDRQVMMIQEQVALFLNVRNFRRRYPELKRRAVAGDERDFVLAKAIVDETLCELGATAVDASEVLDIMLSDYPHKYEEYRSHQRVRQLAQANTSPVRNEVQDEKLERIEMKEPRPEPGKTERVDPEKLRQELAAAAIASASEFNARLNARRRTACVDLQSGVVHRPRRPPAAPRAARVRPPAGWYPLAVLPGQWRHAHSRHAPEELSCLPLNTVLRAPPPGAGAAASDSDGGWSSDEQDAEPDAEERAAERGAKRRKVAKPRRSRSESDDEAATCRACGLRAEGNRKYSHERFLSCARCGEHVHPACSALPPDTVRKCREYAWACAACKACAACRRPPGAARLLLCDLCDRGFHAPCVGLDAVPPGRWHCVECALCKSCGANDPAGLTGAGTGSTGAGSTGTPAAGTGAGTPGGDGPEWHHRTKRGPGGHKVYSHSLCTPCARAYRIGRYCPLCDRSFVGPKGTMQLVICKLCDRQLHQECVKQSVSNLNVLDYTCAECRRGGITSRAAAVRLAPRTIATLFMAKRRFNKYEYRKYMQSRMKSTDAPDAPDALDDSVSDAPPDESLDAEDPLGCGADDEAASAVKALQMDFGD